MHKNHPFFPKKSPPTPSTPTKSPPNYHLEAPTSLPKKILTDPEDPLLHILLIEDMLMLYGHIVEETQGEIDERTGGFLGQIEAELEVLKEMEESCGGDFGKRMRVKEKAKEVQGLMEVDEEFGRVATQWIWEERERAIKEEMGIPFKASEREDSKQGDQHYERIEESKRRNDLINQSSKRSNKASHKVRLEDESMTPSQSNLTYSYLSMLFNSLTESEVKMSPQSRLTLGLTNENHMNFILSLETRIPYLLRLDLYSIPEGSLEVKGFMAHHFPVGLEAFHFNAHSELSDTLDIFMPEIMKISQKVERKFFLYNFFVSQENLVALFEANKDLEWFGFAYCNLDLSSVPDFGHTLAGSSIKGLSLKGCGESSLGDWETNEAHFENLITGLARSDDFRANLEKLTLRKCGMEEEKVIEILRTHGFGHVIVKNYSK